MLTPTHLVFSQAAFFTACIATSHAPAPAEALVAATGALIPDLDKRASYVGRLVAPLAGWIEHQFGHRTVTHSLLAQLVVGLLLWPLLPFGVWLALLAGWVSHSLADMMTPSGVCWFWPARVRCILPGNHELRIEELSGRELGFAACMAAACFPLLVWAGSGAGTSGLIRAALGRIEAARQQYDASKGTHAWRLAIEGRDNRSFADIAGTYPIRGPWQADGFILDAPAGPVSVCQGQACDWYAESAVLERGAPERISVRQVQVGRLSGRELAGLLQPLAEAGTVYLIGTVRSRAVQDDPPTVAVSGETVTLRYATFEALAEAGPLRELALTVQVRHPPGAAVPVLEQATRSGDGDRLPALLRPWIEPPDAGARQPPVTTAL
jgi:inner membrane protein